MEKAIKIQRVLLAAFGLALLGISSVTAQDAAPQHDEFEAVVLNGAEIEEPPATPPPLAPLEFVELGRPGNGDTNITVTASERDDDRINITLRDVELIDVVEMFTTLSGANILSVPTNLTGRVTVNLTNVEWKPALESILAMHQLQIRETMPDTQVYSIVRKDPEAPEPMEVETIFLDYAKVSDVQPVIQSMMLPGGTLSPFPSRNALVVRSTRANLADIKKLVEKIDTFRDQVFIEAKFMELDDTAIKDLGINWQVLQDYSMGIGGMNWQINQQREWERTRGDRTQQWDDRSRMLGWEEDVTYSYSAPAGGDGFRPGSVERSTPEEVTYRGQHMRTDADDMFTRTSTDMRSAILSADDFRLMLSALQQVNGVSVVSNPKIIVANEESAVIHIGQTEKPFEAELIPATQTADARVIYRPGAPVDFGVKLTVTPTVNTMSNITVRIAPELTRFVAYDVAPDGRTRYPIVATKNIQTMFCLESGKTVAIGGLTETEDRDDVKKVPLLGDIPIIGKYLFSHKSTKRSQRETIIFVTVGLAMPGTMDPADGFPRNTDLTHREMMRSELRRQQLNAEREQLQTALDSDDRKTRNRALRRR